MEKKSCDFIGISFRHYTHIEGIFYNMPHSFPCVLHDPQGCIRLDQGRFEELVALGEIKVSKRKDGSEAINIRKRICSLKDYNLCPDAHICPKARFRALTKQERNTMG